MSSDDTDKFLWFINRENPYINLSFIMKIYPPGITDSDIKGGDNKIYIRIQKNRILDKTN